LTDDDLDGRAGPQRSGVHPPWSWYLGDRGPWRYGWGPVDDEQSVAAIRRAVDEGINWVDTAAVYGLGHS
jgi:Aldo/keto reductase family